MNQTTQPTEVPAGAHPVLDLSAALWAALASAVVFAVLCTVALGAITEINHWAAVRLFASVILGTEVLAPPATHEMAPTIAGSVVLLVFGFCLSMLLSVTIHRFGLLIGLIGGALYGLVIYVAFVHVGSMAWPYLATLQGVPFGMLCMIFGAFAGGLYEWLEVDEDELAGESH